MGFGTKGHAMWFRCFGSGLLAGVLGLAMSRAPAHALDICVDSKVLDVKKDECLTRGMAVMRKYFSDTFHNGGAVFGRQGDASSAAILCDDRQERRVLRYLERRSKRLRRKYPQTAQRFLRYERAPKTRSAVETAIEFGGAQRQIDGKLLQGVGELMVRAVGCRARTALRQVAEFLGNGFDHRP